MDKGVGPAPNTVGVSRIASVGYSFADQALAVGGTFLVNVALARTRSKAEYGIFALSYSIYTFLTGLHNAAILEPFTVYGAGRYRHRFSSYLRLMRRSNTYLGLLLSVLVLSSYLILKWIAPQLASGTLLGLGLTVCVLLSGLFLRRVFYVQRQPGLAALASLICFATVACGLWVALRGRLLNGFSAFLILALGWLTANVLMRGRLSVHCSEEAFLESEPTYWREHWKYSRWVMATAPVFQFTTQGYYWLLAGLLSVREVAEFRAAYNFVAPVELAFASLVFLVLPALSTQYQHHSRGRFLVLLKRYILAVLAIAVLFPLAARALGKLGMHLLYAGRFDDCVPLLYVLAFLPIFTAISTGMASALNAAEKPKFVFFAYLASGSTTFIAGIPLILRFGLRGAVYGMLLSGAVFCIALTTGFVLGIWKKAQLGSLPQLGHALAGGSTHPASAQEAR